MKSLLEKFLNAELNEKEEKNLFKSLKEENSAEGDMARAFVNYKNEIQFPTREKKFSSLTWRVAAVITLTIISISALVYVNSRFSQNINPHSWREMTSFDRIQLLNSISVEEADQAFYWNVFQSEKHINVKIALLRILEDDTIAQTELQHLIDNEKSPMVKASLMAINYKK